jgi:hypothetical protein
LCYRIMRKITNFKQFSGLNFLFADYYTFVVV